MPEPARHSPEAKPTRPPRLARMAGAVADGQGWWRAGSARRPGARAGRGRGESPFGDMRLFKRLFLAMNEASIEYLVGGGVAVNLYGIERATADIDIILNLDAENTVKFVKVAKELGFQPKIPVNLYDFLDPAIRRAWASNKNMIVFSLIDAKNPFFVIDVFIEIPFDFERVYSKRKIIEFENTFIPIVPLDELIKMKEKSNRPQDKSDVFYLRKIMSDWKDDV
jgi:hypothetical protein